MKEMRDSEIRLFGKKIALQENSRILEVVNIEDENGCESNQNSTGSDSDRSLDGKKVSIVEESELAEYEKEQIEEEDDEEEDEEKQETDKDCVSGDCCETKLEEKDQDSTTEELENSEVVLESDDSPNSPPMDEDCPVKESGNAENDQDDANNSQQKKKPDKILPCPRCNSMDTKFCYYNNYNINQPRHFCKSCQRYWTAGGTMRNVPVGAGRRKSKNSSSHCRHITISEALQAARIDAPNGFHHPTFKPNGTVLSFGPDIPLCDSMASVLNLTEKKVPNGTQNGFYKVDPGMTACSKGAENGDDCSSGSSVTTSSSMVEGGKNGQQEPVMQHINGFHSPVPCLPGVPWPFPWNSAVPLPAICPSAFPLPFYPAPYWNCSVAGVAGVPGAWSIPWMPPVSPTASQKQTGSGPNSPTLGKHSRDGELLNKPKSPQGKESSEKNNSETPVLVPKTLRIDDPEEAAKSSIWTTLGIKYDCRGGFFKAFQPKSKEKEHLPTTSPVLQANPAALSRSVTFQETA